MEEIKVGEYVRNKKGEFFRYSKENSAINDFMNMRGNRDITKHSPNIIDLIEVGDYVNGCNVVDVKEYGVVVSGGFGEIYLSQIDNIVTHEQFNSIKYVIGE